MEFTFQVECVIVNLSFQMTNNARGGMVMLTKIKGNILFEKLLKRPDICKAYAMVPPTDSWYDTITKVHNSLAEIRKLPHDVLSLVSHDRIELKGIYYPGSKESSVTVICIHGYTSHAEREWKASVGRDTRTKSCNKKTEKTSFDTAAENPAGSGDCTCPGGCAGGGLSESVCETGIAG